jgi:hypothetical protein
MLNITFNCNTFFSSFFLQLAWSNNKSIHNKPLCKHCDLQHVDYNIDTYMFPLSITGQTSKNLVQCSKILPLVYVHFGNNYMLY